ncbi:MAG: cobalamin-dependent protein [Candidatus Omnitrophica bacterium]|nr:cobalamin-dependent protein [Candidatus Omnitrophota bacterium]
MKILLMQPFISGMREALIESIIEPLGIAYIAGVLEKEGYSVKILDCLGEGMENLEYLGKGIYRIGMRVKEIEESLISFKPDTVGISCMFSAYYRDALLLAERVKKKLPNIPVVLGGVHCTVDPRSVISHPAVDIVVRGEGELTLILPPVF